MSTIINLISFVGMFIGIFIIATIFDTVASLRNKRKG